MTFAARTFAGLSHAHALYRAWSARRLRKDRLWIGFVFVALVGVMALGLATGSSSIAWPDLAPGLTDSDHPVYPVLAEIRAPRVLAAGLVGSGLGAAGLLLQTAVRNPLADPGLLGVTAAAGTAALVSIVFFPEQAFLAPAFAFVGGLLAASLLILATAASGRPPTPLRMILTGVGVQALFFAIIAVITFFFADRAPAFAGFVVGSLNGVGWAEVQRVAFPILLGLGACFLLIRTLDVLRLDDASAAGIGVGILPARLIAAGVSALLTSGAVSLAGMVGFVGLVVPNAARIAVGPEHRLLLPMTVLSGATLVIVADLVARTLVPPLELPVGALLALIGAPYFLYLLWRRTS